MAARIECLAPHVGARARRRPAVERDRSGSCGRGETEALGTGLIWSSQGIAMCRAATWSVGSRPDREPVDAGEHSIVGDEFEVEVDGGCRDPPVGFVQFLAERVPIGFAGCSEPGTSRHQRVVGLDDREVCDAAFERTSSKFTPVSFQSSVSKFGDRRERQDDATASDEPRVLGGGFWLPGGVEDRGHNHRVEHHRRLLVARQRSIRACSKASHSSSETPSIARSAGSGSGLARRSAS